MRCGIWMMMFNAVLADKSCKDLSKQRNVCTSVELRSCGYCEDTGECVEFNACFGNASQVAQALNCSDFLFPECPIDGEHQDLALFFLESAIAMVFWALSLALSFVFLKKLTFSHWRWENPIFVAGGISSFAVCCALLAFGRIDGTIYLSVAQLGFSAVITCCHHLYKEHQKIRFRQGLTQHTVLLSVQDV